MASRKARLLRNLRITRVDLVDQGANFDPKTGEGSHIVLYKSAAGEPPVKKEMLSMACPGCDEQLSTTYKDGAMVMPGFCPNCGAELTLTADGKRTEKKLEATMKFDLAKLSEKLRAGFEALISKMGGEKIDADAGAALQGVITEAEAVEANAASVTKERDAATEKAVALEKAAKKDEFDGMPEGTVKLIKELRSTVSTLQDEKETREFEAVVKAEMPKLSAAPETVAKVLKAVKPAVGKELYEELVRILKGASEQIDKGNLFGESGSTGGAGRGDGSAQDEAIRKAEERIAKAGGKDKLTFDVALREVFAAEPALHKRYLDDVRVVPVRNSN